MVYSRTSDTGYPANLARFATRRRLAAQRPGGQDDRELLASLAVACVEDHVLRVRVDLDDSTDLALPKNASATLKHIGSAVGS
jgi:hypothetical protein